MSSYLNNVNSITAQIERNTADLSVITSDVKILIAELLESSKPLILGAGIKTANSDGSLGLNHKGLNYFGAEILGSTSTAFTTYKSICPLLTGGQFIKLPTAPFSMKMSSDSILDTNQLFFVLGYDANYARCFDVFQLNGRTSVLGLYNTPMVRIIGGQVIQSNFKTPGTVTAGNIYLVQSDYNLFTLGVPNDLSNCTAVALAGTGNIYVSYWSLGPGVSLYASQLVISSNASGNSTTIDVSFFSQMGTQSGFRLLATLSVNSTLPSISLDQSCFPDLNTDASGSLPHDLVLAVRRTSGNSDNIQVNVFLSCMQVTPIV